MPVTDKEYQETLVRVSAEYNRRAKGNCRYTHPSWSEEENLTLFWLVVRFLWEPDFPLRRVVNDFRDEFGFRTGNAVRVKLKRFRKKLENAGQQ